jgi:sugar phosphate isomerase/epimerase
MIKLCAFADEYSPKLVEQIEGLKNNGISYIELRNVDGKNVLDLTLEEAENVYNTLKQNGIDVWSIGSPIGKVDINCDFEAYKQKVHHACKLANVFKTDKIRMFSFFHAYEKSEVVFKYLNEMCEIAKLYNVRLHHENEKDVFGDTIDRVLQIMENVNGLDYIFDPANYIQCGQDCALGLEKLFNTTNYFHIKDVISETGQLVPAGYGDGKIREMLKMVDRDLVLTIEPHLAVFEGYANIDNTEMTHKFVFSSNKEAFNFAVKSIKELLVEAGYSEENNAFTLK